MPETDYEIFGLGKMLGKFSEINYELEYHIGDSAKLDSVKLFVSDLEKILFA